MNSRLMFIHALSPIHCGTGQAIGGIDLPIAREKPTNLPLIPGSTIKGVLRSIDDGDKKNEEQHLEVFGPDTDNADSNAGSVQFSDALTLFIPMRSLKGTFAWVTSPYMLQRFVRELDICGKGTFKVPKIPDEKWALVTESSKLLHNTGAGNHQNNGDGKVVFEDLDFNASKDKNLSKLTEIVANLIFLDSKENPDLNKNKKHFAQRVCLLHDDVMALILETCTEIAHRIRIEEGTKTVAKGALWTEEALPVETILAGMIVATPVKQKATDKIPKAKDLLDYTQNLIERDVVQLGGGATIGRGLCRLTVSR